MPKRDDLARVFKALADPTRLSIVERLSNGPCAVTQLAQPLSMSLPAVMQHVSVLENCGVVSTQKIGRVRTCSLRPRATSSVENWIQQNKHEVDRTFERLDSFLAHQANNDEEDQKRMNKTVVRPGVVHSSFTLSRTFPQDVADVFAAWSDEDRKRQWFAGPSEWDQDPYVLDFRVGGVEHAGGGVPGGPTFRYDAHYWDIISEQRIVTTYQMRHDEALASVSVVSIEFEPVPGGTTLTYTEQGAYLDGVDTVEARQAGTDQLLTSLQAHLTNPGPASVTDTTGDQS